MRRRAVPVRVDKETEFRVDLLIREPQRLEHARLQLRVAYADRAGAELNPVDNEVIRLCGNGAGVAFNQRQALLGRHCKRVVHRGPLACLVVLFKKRHVGYPQKFVALRYDIKLFCDCRAKLAQHGESYAVPIGNNQHNIAFFGAHTVNYGLHKLLRYKLRKRHVRSVLMPTDVREALGADAPRRLGQLVDLLARECSRRIFSADCTHASARLNRAVKDRKAAAADYIGYVRNLKAVPRVGLVRAKARHALFKCHARQGQRNFNTLDLPHKALDVTLDHLQNIARIDKRHLEVNLRELRLPVGAQVLVTQAAGKLHIPVKSGEH